MGQLFKFGGLVGACAFVLAATPVLAGGHFAGRGIGGLGGGVNFGPPLRPGFRVRPGMAFRPGIVARPRFDMAFHPGFNRFHNRFFGRGPGFFGSFGRFGFDYGYAFPRGLIAPGFYGAGLSAGNYSYYSAPAAAYPSYPVGYDDASYAPTGNGVVYNVPTRPCCAPKIIYISGGHARRETYLRPRQNIIVRGAASVD